VPKAVYHSGCRDKHIIAHEGARSWALWHRSQPCCHYRPLRLQISSLFIRWFGQWTGRRYDRVASRDPGCRVRKAPLVVVHCMPVENCIYPTSGSALPCLSDRRHASRMMMHVNYAQPHKRSLSRSPSPPFSLLVSWSVSVNVRLLLPVVGVP